MPNISKVVFYFANPRQDNNGNPVPNDPVESHTLTWQQVVDNVGFLLSTGEMIYTEVLDVNDPLSINIVNGFYFGTGKYGKLLGVEYKFEDTTSGFITNYTTSANSENMSMIVGDWFKDLSYSQVKASSKWTGTPLIGYQGDMISLKIKRDLPDMFLTLKADRTTLDEMESVTLDFNTVNYCEGEISYKWEYSDPKNMYELSRTKDKSIIQFYAPGTYTIRLNVTNECNQLSTKLLTFTVKEVIKNPCGIKVMPSTANIRLGESFQFDAIHPFQDKGVWTFDRNIPVIEETEKRLRLKPTKLGSYTITYSVNGCQERVVLYVQEASTAPVFEDPVEPPAPPLPNLPPHLNTAPNILINLREPSQVEEILYKYPNIMKRNARYRGHRESEKVLNDHAEQVYDIRKLYSDIDSLTLMTDITINAWFNGEASFSIFMKSEVSEQNHEETSDILPVKDVDATMAFGAPVIQSTQGNPVVGIYDIKRRMQELDERIAEAKGRCRTYENAFE